MSLRTSESKIQNNQWGHSEAVSTIPTTQIQVKFPTRFYKLRVKKKLEMQTLFFFVKALWHTEWILLMYRGFYW